VHLNKSISYYVFIFILAYIGLSLIVAVLSEFTSEYLSVFNFITALIAAVIAGLRFLKIEKRPPSKPETKKLTLWSYLIFIGFNLFGIALFFYIELYIQKLPPWDLAYIETRDLIIAIILAIFLFVINYAFIRWSFGRLLRKRAEKRNIQDVTFD